VKGEHIGVAYMGVENLAQLRFATYLFFTCAQYPDFASSESVCVFRLRQCFHFSLYSLSFMCRSVVVPYFRQEVLW
jgi:hypothetical protein